MRLTESNPFLSAQFHAWRVENCTLMLPFMCQKKGKVNESAGQERCSVSDVSILHAQFFKDHLAVVYIYY